MSNENITSSSRDMFGVCIFSQRVIEFLMLVLLLKMPKMYGEKYMYTVEDYVKE